MNREEILSDEFVENEIVQSKSNKKVKIVVALASSLAIVAIITLLVGHFKFNWFKNEVYNLDAKIDRNLYQANYFTEIKTLNTKIGFTNGLSEVQESTIYTNFMVLISDKTEFLNTAILVILDTKVKSKDKLKDLVSFDIFNEEKIKEVIANPDGSKYPFALFKFYENGTIDDIQLPKNMDSYNAQSIIELIEKVIPKLSRNRTEDISNGLKVNTKKGKKKNTIVESQSPKELPGFRGSKFVKSIERDIENNELKKISSNLTINLETKLEEGQSSLGYQDFIYDQKSKIISTSSIEEKEKAQLLLKISEHFTFINAKDLLESSSKKENTEKVYIIGESDEKDVPKLRKLAYYHKGNITCPIKKYNIFGKSISIEAKIGQSEGIGFAYYIIKTEDGISYFGKDGVNNTKRFSGELSLVSFPFDYVPGITITLKVNGGGDISIDYDYDSVLRVTAFITLYAKGEVKSGWEYVSSISAIIKGTLISGTFGAKYSPYGTLGFSGSFDGSDINIYVTGKSLDSQDFHHSFYLSRGWKQYIH